MHWNPAKPLTDICMSCSSGSSTIVASVQHGVSISPFASKWMSFSSPGERSPRATQSYKKSPTRTDISSKSKASKVQQEKRDSTATLI